jgi:hypothetical protein
MSHTEDAPYAWVVRHGESEPRTVTYIQVLADQAAEEGAEVIALYTRKTNDKLRRAAEDAELLLTELEAGYGFDTNEEYEVLDNLRDALRESA